LALTINGLDYTCDVAETRSGDDVLALVRRNDLAGSSFAFNVAEDEWRNNGGLLLRHSISVRLVDVAPVGIPAYEQATVSLRSLAAQCDAPLRDVLGLARDNQLSKLLVRTDIDGGKPAKKPKSGRQAWIETMGMKDAVEHRESAKKPKSGREALIETLGCRWTSLAPKTAAQRRAELTRMRYGPYQTASEVGLDENY
jgi:hypothetical protein